MLSEKEVQAIGNGDTPSKEQSDRIFGLQGPVRHPWHCSREDAKEMAKGANQKWNPNCFMGLGWKGDKDGKKAKAKQEAAFASFMVRSPKAPHGGLKNHGATCYLNSMLQCLFFNMPFRKSIMQLTQEGGTGSGGVPDGVRAGERFKPILELQKIFSHLQISKARAFDPKEFIEGLKLSCTVQQDAQEFLKMYLNYIENELSTHKHSIPVALQTLVKDTFVGELAYCTTCKECHQKSPNRTVFYDLDLKVKNVSTLEASLHDFFKEDELVGENKYECGKCEKKTEARRGIELLRLPTVLNLQLLRFVYDANTNTRKKVVSFINFPKELDLGTWLENGESAAASGKRHKVASAARGGGAAGEFASRAREESAAGSCIYDLEAVVMHTGASAVQGHYIAHVQHPRTKTWWRFDDEHVSSLQDDEYFGGAEALAKARKKRKAPEQEEMQGRVKSKDAYMLMYRRRTTLVEGEDIVADDKECKDMIPIDLQHEIEQNSKQLEEQAKTAEETSRSGEACRERSLRMKEEIWEKLPDESRNGYWISTDWLKHWVSLDPVEKCDKIDTGPLMSMYHKADPTKVHGMKLVSSDAFELLCNTHGITEGSTKLGRGDMCFKTVTEECKRRSQNRSKKEILDSLKILLAEQPKNATPGDFWVSKRWCKQRLSGSPTDEDPQGEDVYCCHDSSSTGQGGQMQGSDRCKPEGMTPDKTKRRLVTARAVEFFKQELKELMPAMFPGDKQACEYCTQQAEGIAYKNTKTINERSKIKAEHKSVYAGSSIKLKSGHSYYLISYQWVESFRDFIQISDIQKCIEIDNKPLLHSDESGVPMLAYDPGDLTPHQPPKFLWLEETDWKRLQQSFGGGPELKVVPLLEDDADGLRSLHVNRLPAKSAQLLHPYFNCSCSPEVCQPFVRSQKEKGLQERLEYENASISVIRHSASASSAATSAADGGAASAAAPTTSGSMRRGRQRTGDMQIPVSSSSTVKSIKLHIYEKLHFSPSEQKLMYQQKELEAGDQTLRHYSVPRDAQLVLHILTTDGSEDMGRRSKGEGDAGFSGTLLSGFMPTERDNSALVVTGVGQSQDQPRAEGVDADVQDSQKSGRRKENKAVQCAEPAKIESKSVLGELPQEGKRISKPPAVMDGSTPSKVGKGRCKSGDTANEKPQSRPRKRKESSSVVDDDDHDAEIQIAIDNSLREVYDLT